MFTVKQKKRQGATVFQPLLQQLWGWWKLVIPIWLNIVDCPTGKEEVPRLAVLGSRDPVWWWCLRTTSLNFNWGCCQNKAGDKGFPLEAKRRAGQDRVGQDKKPANNRPWWVGYNGRYSPADLKVNRWGKLLSNLHCFMFLYAETALLILILY